MKKFIVALLISSAVATPAAAEVFSGPYVGVEVGMDNFELQGADVFAPGDEYDGLSANGVMGGVFAGYDYAFSGVFAGVEASASISDASMTYDDTIDTLQVSARNSYGASARLGAMLNDSTALYGRVGWSNTKFKATENGVADSDRDDALVLGAGVETRVGAGSLRVEYNRADYTDELKNNRVTLGYAFRF